MADANAVTWYPEENLGGDFGFSNPNDSGSGWSDFLGGSGGKSLLTGAGALLGEFLAPGGANKNLTESLGTEQGFATTNQSQGQGLLAKGNASLAPVLSYLSKLTSGDPALALSATAPARQRVIDQYDVARRTAATGPRGGGTASAITGSYAKEASDLGVLQAGAQTDAEKEQAQLATTLENLGINAESLAGSEMSSVVQGYIAQAQQENQTASGIGSGLGTILGALAFL